jgi:hypothetical protein
MRCQVTGKWLVQKTRSIVMNVENTGVLQYNIIKLGGKDFLIGWIQTGQSLI